MTAKLTSPSAFVAYWNVVQLQSDTWPVQFMLWPIIFLSFFCVQCLNEFVLALELVFYL